ncbi:MAG: hypothetical protein KDE51_09510 [Anaerolineales bacterium]|nr:hypothetical protein [Anaerolineales bacterium]
MKQVRWIIFLSFTFVFLYTSPSLAQTPRPTPTNEPPPTSSNGSNNGSIRGTVYQDQDQDGRCAAGDPIIADIPLQFVSNDGETVLFLQSGENGTYGLVAVGYGTWQVSAIPPAPWHVTSQTPLSVFVDQDNLLALNIDFCLSDVEATTSSVVFLPSSGASANPLPFLVSMLLGMVFLSVGILIRRRA